MPDTKVQEQMKCMMKHKIVMETLRIRHFFLFLNILTDMQQAANRGTFELEGTTKLGQHLDDGLEHTEFYLDKMAIVKTLKDLYNM